jgi:protease PrsW
VSSAVVDATSALRGSRLFGGLADDELRAIADQVHLETFAAGSQMINEGEIGTACYVVKSGQAIVVSRDLVGQEVTLAAYGPGDAFGEVALVTHEPRTASVRAETAVEAYVLTRDAFERLASADPPFRARLLERVQLIQTESFIKRASPFAQLPPETIDRLLRELQPQRVHAGEVIVRQGDEADRFYVVRSGRVEVLEGNTPVRTLEAGDCFGEVALMQSTRRTATVRAVDETELLTLGRAEFDAVVRENPSLRNRLAEFTRIRYRAASGQPLALPDPISTLMPFVEASRRERYWVLLGVGVAAFVGLSVLAALIGGPLTYAALIVGSFVSPLVYVAYLFESDTLADRPVAIVVAFALGAALGLPLAIRIEQATGAQAGELFPAFLVAVVEESAKLFSVVWLLRRRTARFQMDGTIYGAAVGMGFAAFETVLFGIAQIGAVGPLLVTLWIRALLAPFGHGTWSAIVGSVLWRKRTTPTGLWLMQLAGAFAFAVLLHTVWDWQPLPGLSNVVLFLLVGAVGILVLRSLIHRATVEELGAVLALNPEVAATTGDVRAVRCRQCGLLGPPGSHYCTRCGAVLRLS